MKFPTYYDVSIKLVDFYTKHHLSNTDKRSCLFQMSNFLIKEFELEFVNIRHQIINFVFLKTDFDDVAVVINDLRRFHYLISMLIEFEEEKHATYTTAISVKDAFDFMKPFIRLYFAPYVHCWSTITAKQRNVLLATAIVITDLYARSYTCYKNKPTVIKLSAEEYAVKLQSMFEVIWIVLFENANEIVSKTFEKINYPARDYMIPITDRDADKLIRIIYTYITTE